MKKILPVIILFLTIDTCLFAQQSTKTQQGGEVIYHVVQRSFYDSNGDAHGDLAGLREKLDYLQNLGITTILMLPLYEAAFYHNYFADDFEEIDPEFGTMQDYLELVKEVHRRGMKLVMDMETQYVTSEHLWWKDAVGNLQSPYSDYILFDDDAHTTPATMIFGLRALTGYDGKTVQITTVNLKSKAVLDYNIRLFSFFADPNKDGRFEDGIDGFRLDHAMDHLDGKPTLTNLLAGFWKPLIDSVKKINPAVTFVAEQADWNDYGFDYFSKAGVDRMFGFGMLGAIASFDKKRLTATADTLLGLCPTGKEQVIFLENHDLDRFATLVPDKAKQRLAAALQLFIGGVPSIYYGQELGMTGKGGFGIYGNTDGNDIPRREAFEWTASGEGKGVPLWYKNTGPWWDKRYNKPGDGISVEEQQQDPGSLLQYYKTLIQIRQQNPALSMGNYATAANSNDQVFSFTRIYGKDQVLVVANLSATVQQATLLKTYKMGKAVFGTMQPHGNTIQLQPYSVAVVQVK